MSIGVGFCSARAFSNVKVVGCTSHEVGFVQEKTLLMVFEVRLVFGLLWKACPLDQVLSKSFGGAGLSFEPEVVSGVSVGVVVPLSFCNISACWLIMVAFWALSRANSSSRISSLAG